MRDFLADFAALLATMALIATALLWAVALTPC